MKKLTVALGLILSLTACSHEYRRPEVENRELLPKIGINVKRISLADRSGMQPTNSPYKNNSFSPTISQSIKQWASDRLQANGQDGQAIIVIKEASLARYSMPMEGGIDRLILRQQATKYIAKAEVALEASGPNGYAVTEATATRAVSLPEDPSEFEKQDAYYILLKGLMKDLGENLETGIHTHMAGFVTTPPIYGATAVPTGANPAETVVPSGAVAPAVISPTLQGAAK